MKTTDNLFTLIKSLNKSEKGYFKKNAYFHVLSNERNNYIKIFDAIDAQDSYNEPKLLKKFKHERFIKQFAVAKNYLYDIILESLEAYNKTWTIELRSALNRAEILVSKGLPKQAKKILKKAKKNAVEREEFTYVLEIKLLEQSIDCLLYKEVELKNNIEIATIDELKRIIAQIENVATYEQLKNQVYLQSLEAGSSYTSVEIKNFDWIIENPLLKNKEQALSHKAEIFFNELHAIYYEYIGDFEKSYSYSLNINQLIQKNPLVKNSQASFLYRHSLRCSNNGLQGEALETMRFLEHLPLKTEIEKNNRSFMVIHVKLNVYFQLKKIKECLVLIPELKIILDNDKPVDISLKEEMNRHLMSLLIISGQYKVALSRLIKKNLENSFSYNHGINYVERIIEIILHYELENFDIIDQRVKSMHRFLSLKNKANGWENILLSFFRYLINDVKKKPQVVSNVTFLLESETMSSLENNSLPYFVVISWLKSKINNLKTFQTRPIQTTQNHISQDLQHQSS